MYVLDIIYSLAMCTYTNLFNEKLGQTHSGKFLIEFCYFNKRREMYHIGCDITSVKLLSHVQLSPRELFSQTGEEGREQQDEGKYRREKWGRGQFIKVFPCNVSNMNSDEVMESVPVFLLTVPL